MPSEMRALQTTKETWTWRMIIDRVLILSVNMAETSSFFNSVRINFPCLWSH